MGESDANVMFPGADLMAANKASEVIVLSDPVFADAYESESEDELPPFPLPLAFPAAFGLPNTPAAPRAPVTATISKFADVSALPQSTAASRSAADIFPPLNATAAPPELERGPAAVPIPLPKAASQAEPRFRRIIRIRDSLAGAWAEEDVIDLASSPETGAEAGRLESVPRKGKEEAKGKAGAREAKTRNEKGRTRTKEWRVSQVEVLDLS